MLANKPVPTLEASDGMVTHLSSFSSVWVLWITSSLQQVECHLDCCLNNQMDEAAKATQQTLIHKHPSVCVDFFPPMV